MSIDLRLRNESTKTAVDLILFTFQDSATSQLRTALTNKDLSPTELYELQLQLAGTAPFKLATVGEKAEPAIGAGKSSVFTIEVVGIPGLVNGTVQVDYAHLGVDLSDVGDKFYTRQLSVPIAVTVNAGVEIPRCNLLPFCGDFAWSNKDRASRSTRPEAELKSVSKSLARSPSHIDDGQFTSLLARLGLGSHGENHCLLLLDLRNVWPSPLSVSVQVRESVGGSSSPTDPWRRAYTVHESLQPGHITRAVLLVPRVHVSDPHAPIPLIGPQNQFVVRESKLSIEAEQANREAFWYREELLKLVRGTWREDNTGREGTMDLRRGIRLNARMIYSLKIEDVEISLSIHTSKTPAGHSSPVSQLGRSRFRLHTNSFAVLTTKVHNRGSTELRSVVRIQPSLRDQPHTIALDLSKRLAWTGMLQRVLHPPLAPDEVREINLGVMALAAGAYEIGATVEELKLKQATPTPHVGAQSRGTDITTTTTTSRPKAGRRIWHTREPCMIDAIEVESLP